MFNKSKYTQVYHNLISHAIKRGYGNENHHIIPKSCGGEDKPYNIVSLSFREHFIAHRLLPKILVSETHQLSMLRAVFLMSSRSKYSGSHTYESYRKSYSNLMKKDNPMFNPVTVKKQVAGRSHDQSAVASKRNKIYWADPANRQALSERNIQNSRRRGLRYIAQKEIQNHTVYTQKDLSALTGTPKGSLPYYLKTGRVTPTGWLIRRLVNKDGSPQRPS